MISQDSRFKEFLQKNGVDRPTPLFLFLDVGKRVTLSLPEKMLMKDLTGLSVGVKMSVSITGVSMTADMFVQNLPQIEILSLSGSATINQRGRN